MEQSPVLTAKESLECNFFRVPFKAPQRHNVLTIKKIFRKTGLAFGQVEYDKAVQTEKERVIETATHPTPCHVCLIRR